jgi:ubiquinone/menaquinone biosynthesis C-methylase UbiE
LGTGSYEPADHEVVAIDPSPVMIAQPPANASPVVMAAAERQPFRDKSFNAAMLFSVRITGPIRLPD